MAPRRVLVTGVGGHWGAVAARRLMLDPAVETVIGLDLRRPEEGLELDEFIEADIRSPVLSRLLPGTEVDTIVHCGILWYPEPGRPARVLHDVNVIGTLQLLAACERTPTLETLVVRGSAAIYGSEPASPSFLTEEMARRFPLRTRFQRDAGELEGYFDNFARRNPGVSCCMLRYQPEIGPDLDAPIARYLELAVVPVQLGFDPRLQFVHSEDATGALVAAVKRPVRGAVNVAPTGSVTLTRLLRMARRPRVGIPHPAFGLTVSGLGRTLGLATLQEDAIRLLRYGRCLENERLREEVGFEPRFDAVEAVRDHVERAASRRVVPVPGLGDLLGRLVGA